MNSIIFIGVGDIIAMVFIGAFLIVAAYSTIMRITKQRRCLHDGGVNETQACDAICKLCGKNLGFIGAWRDSQKQKEAK